jgi:hypothetical protein
LARDKFCRKVDVQSGSDPATELGALPAIPLTPFTIPDPNEYNEENDMRFESVSGSDGFGCFNAASGSMKGIEAAIFWEASSFGVKSGSPDSEEDDRLRFVSSREAR